MKMTNEAIATKVVEWCTPWDQQDKRAVITATYGHVRDWDVSDVTSLAGVFRGVDGSCDLDVSLWNTSSVRTMRSMCAWSSLSLDVSAWNTGKVTDMHAMFMNADNFDADVSGWNVGAVRDASNMFMNTRVPARTSFSQWDTRRITKCESFCGDCACPTFPSCEAHCYTTAALVMGLPPNELYSFLGVIIASVATGAVLMLLVCIRICTERDRDWERAKARQSGKEGRQPPPPPTSTITNTVENWTVEKCPEGTSTPRYLRLPPTAEHVVQVGAFSTESDYVQLTPSHHQTTYTRIDHNASPGSAVSEDTAVHYTRPNGDDSGIDLASMSVADDTSVYESPRPFPFVAGVDPGSARIPPVSLDVADYEAQYEELTTVPSPRVGP